MGSQGSRDVRPDGLKVVASVNSSACRREFGTTYLHTKILSRMCLLYSRASLVQTRG